MIKPFFKANSLWLVLLLLSITTASWSQITGSFSNLTPGSNYTYTANLLNGPYQWSIVGGTIVSSSTTKTITVQWACGSGSGSLHVDGYTPLTGGAEPGGGDPASFDRNVTITLVAGGSVGSSISVCPGSFGTLWLAGYSGTIQQWEKSTDAGNNWYSIANSADAAYSYINVQQTTMYRVVVGSGTCYQRSTPATVTVLPLPTNPSVVEGSSCGPGPVLLSATGGSSYKWYSSAGTLIGGITGSTYTTPILNATTTYQVSAVSAQGCESAKTSLTASVNAVPAAPNPLGFSTNTQCGTTIVTGPTAPAGETYYWQATSSGTSTTNPSGTYTANSTTTVYLRGKNNSECWGQSTPFNIAVNNIPSAPPQPITQQRCQSIEITPGAPALPGVTYYWQSSPVGASTSDLAASVNPLTGAASVYPKIVITVGTYYLRAQAFMGCWSAPTQITVSTIPTQVSCLDGQGKNFIVTNVLLKEGVSSETTIDTLGIKSNTQTVSYVDGFGRVTEVVGVQHSPSRQDEVMFQVYDNLGREPKKYLPYTEGHDGRYKLDALSSQSAFYSSAQATPDRRTTTSTPWSETVFESSPANRIKEQGFAGNSWQVGTNHTIKSNIKFNSVNEARKWTYDFESGQITSADYYGAGELLIEETIDEQGNTTWSYKDKLGRTVLVKREVSSSTVAQTYYVFDSFSKIRTVLQPEGVAQLPTSGAVTLTSDFIDKNCFTYQYDVKGRLTQKHVPGSGAIFYVYNKRDQIILTQDANQRTLRQWSFTKYDALEHPVLNGIYTPSEVVTQAEIQTAANNFDGQYESESANNYSTQYGYTIDQSFPTTATGSLRIDAVKYYSGYDFDNNSSTTEATYVASGLVPEPVASSDVTGKLTGVRESVLNTDQMLLTVNFYDKRGNLIQAQQQNHLGGSDVITTVYDFSGKILESKRQHKVRNNSPVLAVRKIYTYDHGGRMIKLQQQINTDSLVNTGPVVTLSANNYNELGQVVAKNLHGTNSGYAQTVDYRYNTRGWLTHINDAALTDPTDMFGEELRYDETPTSNAAANIYFNGNIAEQVTKQYKSKGQAYVFDYDKLNRLVDARYSSKAAIWNASGYDEGGISYDLNGNITSLSRYESPVSQSVRQKIDGLTYNYNGNQLIKIEDTESVTKGFQNGANQAQEYFYDANGNLTEDKNKKIHSIGYNQLNLVRRVLTDSVEIRYSYTASGAKLSKTVITGNNTTVHHYIKGFEYDQNDQLQFFATEEGRVVQQDGAYVYEYNLTDHLGNVRVTFTTKKETDNAKATLENANATGEAGKFLYYNEAVKINSSFFDHTNTGPTFYSTRLNGTPNERTGLARSLSVMPGDTINTEVFVKYLDTNSGNWTSALANLMSSIATGTAPAGTFVDGGAPGSTGGIAAPFAGLLDKSRDIGIAPKAYLNYLVFDRNYNLVTGGFVRVSKAAREYGQHGAHQRLAAQIVIDQPGYLYAYLSNDNDQPVEVYFDDFSVAQKKSLITSLNDYYPYGLAFNSFARENSVPNLYQYNGKELQAELGAGAYDYGARMYDAQIGRWSVVDPSAEKYLSWSPYNYVCNKPTNNIDLDGRDGVNVTGEPKQLEIMRETLRNLWSVPEFSVVSNTLSTSPHKIQVNLTDQSDIGTCQPVNWADAMRKDQPFYYPDGKNKGIGTSKGSDVECTINLRNSQSEAPEIIVGHELFHAAEIMNGTLDSYAVAVEKGKFNVNKNKSSLSLNEIRATDFENILRARFGIPLRRDYKGVVITADGKRVWGNDGSNLGRKGTDYNKEFPKLPQFIVAPYEAPKTDGGNPPKRDPNKK